MRINCSITPENRGQMTQLIQAVNTQRAMLGLPPVNQAAVIQEMIHRISEMSTVNLCGVFVSRHPACTASCTAIPRKTVEKSTFLQHAEKLAADAKELAVRVQRSDVKALTTGEEHRQLRDLVMMVKMLCRTIRKYNPESQQAADYTAYLQKEGLISAADCLRGSDPKETDTEDRRG